MRCVLKKLTIFAILCLAIITFKPSVGYDNDSIKSLDNILYPPPFGVGGGYKTDPWVFFLVDGGLHIRDIHTGELIRVIPMDKNDYFLASDDDSVYIGKGFINEDTSEEYACINILDGKQREYELPPLSTMEASGDSWMIYVYKKEMYRIMSSFDRSTQSSSIRVYCTNGKSWVQNSDKNRYSFFYAGNDLYKKGFLLLGDIENGESYSRFVRIEDGSTYARFEGQYEVRPWSDAKSPLISATLVSDDNTNVFHQNCIINLEIKKVIFTCEKEKYVASIDFVEDHVWIVDIDDFKRNNYISRETGAITLNRMEKDGTISQKIKIDPGIPNLPINDFKVLNDSLVQLCVQTRLILWNFESDNLLLDSPVYKPRTFYFDNIIYCLTYDKMFAIDPQIMSVTWSLPFSGGVSVFETKNKKYLLKPYHSTEKNKDGLIVKIINKADNSLEPYEFFVSPFYGDESKIYDSPYGLVFISNYNICSFAVGGVERFSIRDLYGIQSWKPMDDPRYLEIKYQYDRTYRLDTKTGAFVLVSTAGQ